jgi:hypothetical protein
VLVFDVELSREKKRRAPLDFSAIHQQVTLARKIHLRVDAPNALVLGALSAKLSIPLGALGFLRRALFRFLRSRDRFPFRNVLVVGYRHNARIVS